MLEEHVREVAEGVFWCRGRLVNWYLLREGDDLTLVDAGYPGDVDDVLTSIASVGSHPSQVRAVVVTHAHADHLGAAGALHTAHGTPTHVGPGDLEATRSGHLEQVGLGDVAAAAWRPAVLPWAVRAVRRGGRGQRGLPHARPLTSSGPLDLPGRPVPVPTGGHTPGHTAVHLPHLGVVISGDALVTGHPTSRRSGPQLLASMFSADPSGARGALAELAGLDADLLLPGHGDPHRGPVAGAVDVALSRRD